MPEITMPKLSDTMTEGTLVAWKKKKGDKIAAGDVIAEIETDKATMEWESPEDGVLTEIFVEEGGKVDVGTKIATIGVPGETSAPAKEKPKAAAAAKEQPTSEPTPEMSVPAEDADEESAPREAKSSAPAARSDESARVKASPLARRVAADHGVDLSQVKGTGPGGRVTDTDVRSAAKGKSAKTHAAVKPGEGTRIQLSGMRKGIAERLALSKSTVPHFYLNIEIDAGPLMAARAELKAGGEETAKITVNDFVLKASVEAAVKVPKANAAFDEDAIVQFADVDLAVAVAIEDGLVTPVIRKAQTKSLREISEAVKDLAHRARNKRMKPEEFTGGSFTVSNLGGHGIDSFSAIINPPQGFILSIGAIVKKAVIEKGDQIAVGQRMSIGMSCDHRVIDGALGADYLKELRRLLENPALLLL